MEKWTKREHQDLWYGEGEINEGRGLILPDITVYQSDKQPPNIGVLKNFSGTVEHVAGNTWKAITQN